MKKFLEKTAIFALVLFAQAALATLTVQDFSCNGGQTNVEVGSAFSCNAVIQNDDPNNDASLNTVTLPSLNGWTAQSSYTGTFSGNSVTRGGTKTVSFPNIVPTSPKASNKFTDLLINDAPSNSAKVQETAINVVSINALTVTAPSSAANAAEFDVQASTILGGSATLNSTISLSGGCTLKTGQSTTASFGTAADSTLSTTWKVVQSTSTCTTSITTTALAFPITLTSTKTATTTSTGAAGQTSFGTTGGTTTTDLSTNAPATPTSTPQPTGTPTAAPQATATPAPTKTPAIETPTQSPTQAPAEAEQTPIPLPPAEQGGINTTAILGIAVLIAIAGAGYLYLQKAKAQPQ